MVDRSKQVGGCNIEFGPINMIDHGSINHGCTSTAFNVNIGLDHDDDDDDDHCAW